MPSLDYRYPNAKGDIWQHTVNNDDYPFCWVFEDERFGLKDGSDETYLRFLCEVFHPVVRDEKGYWKEYLDLINSLLQNDGYELYPIKKHLTELYTDGDYIMMQRVKCLCHFHSVIKGHYERKNQSNHLTTGAQSNLSATE